MMGPSGTDSPIGLALSAMLAAIGFVARQVWLFVDERRKEKARRIARLNELAVLLRSALTVHRTQRQRAGRLAARLRRKHPDQPTGRGLERLFEDLHGKMDADERRVHGIIRSMTEAMRELNEGMGAWLAKDTTFKTNQAGLKIGSDLARRLQQLDVHLRLWRAKYTYWITNEPRHALVYLNDEEKHGLPFPKRDSMGQGLDELVDLAQRELKQRPLPPPPPPRKPRRRQRAAPAETERERESERS
jgi:hypothetical protein